MGRNTSGAGVGNPGSGSRLRTRAAVLLLLSPILLWALYLLLLPLFPSQDGPTHLMSGGILFDCLSEREPASSYYFWRSGKLTNQLCTLGLGLLQEAGLGPRLAEGLWHLLLLALLVWTWKRMIARVQAVPSSALLLLLPFMGQVLHMGFYNFLAGVHLGLLAWTFRRPGFKNPWSDLLFVLALYAHPLGAACYLGLCVFDVLIDRRFQDLWTLLPHTLVFFWVSSGNTGGKMGRTPFDFPDLLGHTWVSVTDRTAMLLSLPLLVLLVLALRRGWARLGPAGRRRRIQLLIAASIPMLASGIFPDLFGAATHLRIRAAYLAWVLLLLALAPIRRSEARPLLWLRQALVLALLGFNFAADRSQAQELQAFLDRMPRPVARSTVLAGYDLYQAEVLPLMGGLQSFEPLQLRHNSILDLQSRLESNPWFHILDRWAHEEGLISLNDHQAMYAHSPLGHRKAPGQSWREGLEYKCSQLPLDQLVGAADVILFAHLEQDWSKLARPRLPRDLTVQAQGEDWVSFASAGDSRPETRLASPFFASELSRLPVAWPIPRTEAGTRVHIGVKHFAEANAWFPFRVFVLDFEAKTFRPATKDEIWPTEGAYDGSATATFERIGTPAMGQLYLLPR